MLKTKLFCSVIAIIFLGVLACEKASQLGLDYANDGVSRQVNGLVPKHGNLTVSGVVFSDFQDFLANFGGEILADQHPLFKNSDLKIQDISERSSTVYAWDMDKKILKGETSPTFDGAFTLPITGLEESGALEVLGIIKISVTIVYNQGLMDSGCFLISAQQKNIIPGGGLVVLDTFTSILLQKGCSAVKNQEVVGEMMRKGQLDGLVATNDNNNQSSGEHLATQFASLDERYYTKSAVDAKFSIQDAGADFSFAASDNNNQSRRKSSILANVSGHHHDDRYILEIDFLDYLAQKSIVHTK